MSRFLLYQKKEKVFPTNANADFRNILRIFAILRDNKINQYKRIKKAVEWFGAPPNSSADEFIEAFFEFVNPQTTTVNNFACEIYGTPFQKGALGDEPQFDFDFDAEEIYASFISEYGIDLIEIDFLHWYKFKILLENLSSESAFKKKIELRFMDLSDYKNYNGYAEMTSVKEAVQLPEELKIYELTELEELGEFDNIWGKAGIR
ncbi:MAG: bacteriophage Gp15 family protein [Oscillospiraceae bacterium]|nr:bacteriophage Gp15 family protein [Oscillospiraceae bacterium]